MNIGLMMKLADVVEKSDHLHMCDWENCIYGHLIGMDECPERTETGVVAFADHGARALGIDAYEAAKLFTYGHPDYELVTPKMAADHIRDLVGEELSREWTSQADGHSTLVEDAPPEVERPFDKEEDEEEDWDSEEEVEHFGG